jgi:hypothetical protein
MKLKSLFQVALTLLPTLLVACGAPVDASREQPASSLATVAIEQTAVRDQMAVGFCWAYASMAFMESKYLAEKSEKVDLSEEALGFYRIIDQLEYLTSLYQKDGTATHAELAQVVNKASLQGWFVRRDPKDTRFKMHDAFELIDLYGVVPESVWNVKFDAGKKTTTMENAVRSGYLALMKRKGKSGTVSLQDLKSILAHPKAFGSVPPSEFSFQGRQVSAKELAREVMGFRGSDYSLVAAESSRDLGKVVTALKRGLARGLSVPIGFGVTFSMLKQGNFSHENRPDSFYDSISQEEAARVFVKDGGHAVLVTDYVNKGGREGAMSESEVAAETAKSSEELDYVKFKNSWGLKAGSNERGSRISGSVDGYYKLDLGYLKGEADAGMLNVVVPNDIAAALQ